MVGASCPSAPTPPTEAVGVPLPGPRLLHVLLLRRPLAPPPPPPLPLVFKHTQSRPDGVTHAVVDKGSNTPATSSSAAPSTTASASARTLTKGATTLSIASVMNSLPNVLQMRDSAAVPRRG